MNLLVLDTETSNLPDKGGQIMEIAWNNLEEVDGQWKPTFGHETYVQFTGVCSAVARANHHIDPLQCSPERGAITRENAIILLKRHIKEDTYCVAHNHIFDSKMLPELVVRWIDTMRIAKRLMPNAEAHTNQALRYELDIKLVWPPNSTVKTRHPHQAMYDVATTTGILIRMLAKYTPDELFQICWGPMKVMPFGKHKGKTVEAARQEDPGWFEWMNKQKEVDPDMRVLLNSLGYSAP